MGFPNAVHISTSMINPGYDAGWEYNFPDTVNSLRVAAGQCALSRFVTGRKIMDERLDVPSAEFAQRLLRNCEGLGPTKGAYKYTLTICHLNTA